MRIKYRVTKDECEVPDNIARNLIRARIADEVAESGDIVVSDISPRTGKPKRKYHRRDMTAEA